MSGRAPIDPADPASDASSHSSSEATRLLCAGAYLDSRFRRGTIQELVEHAERAVAPSLGCDAVPVLRHCLYARRLEREAGEKLVAVWAVALWLPAVPLAVGMGPVFDGGVVEDVSGVLTPAVSFAAFGSVWFGLACVLFWLARVLAGRSTGVVANQTREPGGPLSGGRGFLAGACLVIAWAFMTTYWSVALACLLTGLWALARSYWDWAWAPLAPTAVVAALLVALPLTVAWITSRHRARVDHMLRTQLSRTTFSGRGPRVPTKYQPLLDAIAREQHSQLAIYNAQTPFLGAGTAHEPWSLTLELRPANGSPREGRLTSRRILDLVTPLLRALAERAAESSRDRLTGLELTETVFLPAPLPPGLTRADFPTGSAERDREVATHLNEAVDEGAERRRHFLRIQVGAWDEHLVTTVFLRAHTQGGILVLEVAPHVLPPVRPEFSVVDTLPTHARDENRARSWLMALATAPTTSVAAGVSLAQTVRSAIRVRLANPESAPPDAPRVSVRELGAAEQISLFQEMDVNRYVRTIQDRIASGVRQALVEAGYQTDEFQRQVINISDGGVFIGGSMSGGAIASGRDARATHTPDT